MDFNRLLGDTVFFKYSKRSDSIYIANQKITASLFNNQFKDGDYKKIYMVNCVLDVDDYFHFNLFCGETKFRFWKCQANLFGEVAKEAELMGRFFHISDSFLFRKPKVDSFEILPGTFTFAQGGIIPGYSFEEPITKIIEKRVKKSKKKKKEVKEKFYSKFNKQPKWGRE